MAEKFPLNRKCSCKIQPRVRSTACIHFVRNDLITRQGSSITRDPVNSIQNSEERERE